MRLALESDPVTRHKQNEDPRHLILSDCLKNNASGSKRMESPRWDWEENQIDSSRIARCCRYPSQATTVVSRSTPPLTDEIRGAGYCL